MHPFRHAFFAALLAALLSACASQDADTRDASEPLAALPVPSPPSAARAPVPAATERPSTPAPACPEGMAEIDRFCIDRHEARLVARGPGGAVRPHPYFQRPDEGVTYEARSEPGEYPQAYISRVEAQAACENAGKRLCSRREWQRACKGASGAVYPYGLRSRPGACNTEKQHLLTLKFGGDTRLWTYALFNDPSLDQEPGFLARSGDYAGCRSDAGVYDMVGNLHEWVSDAADAAFKARLDSDGVRRAFQYHSPGNGVFMGGFYSTHGELGPGCDFTTIAHEPGYHDYSTGFRCCAGAP